MNRFFRPKGCLLLTIELVHRGSSSILLLPFFWDTLYLSKNFATGVCEAKELHEIHNLHKILGCFMKKYIKLHKLHNFFSFFPKPLVPTNLKSDSIKGTFHGHNCQLFNIEQKIKWTIGHGQSFQIHLNRGLGAYIYY